MEVSPVLIKRQKQHFHHLKDLGVDVIFGCNGWVWVGCHVEPPVEDGAHIAKQAQDNSGTKNRTLVNKDSVLKVASPTATVIVPSCCVTPGGCTVENVATLL